MSRLPVKGARAASNSSINLTVIFGRPQMIRSLQPASQVSCAGFCESAQSYTRTDTRSRVSSRAVWQGLFQLKKGAVARQVKLPEGVHLDWLGEKTSCTKRIDASRSSY